jgi:hypothetical protein
MHRASLVVCVTSFLASIGVAQDAPPTVTSPEAHLGRPVGRDFELADWTEVSSYYTKLASESPRVVTDTVGKTTEGRDFLVCAISSEENIQKLPLLKALARRIADPRGLTAPERENLLRTAKPFLFLSLAMHSNETAAPQFGMELAHRLATSDAEPFKSARDSMVTVILPCTNPDGLDSIVSWYRKTVGTPLEASGMLELYQRYAGHDNNRDWFMLNLEETRIVTRLLYTEWFPQVYWDVHQQGQNGERMFVPPFRDPLGPNLDPGVMAAIDSLCSRAVHDMTRGGIRGVATGVTFDMWWNGGNRNVPVRHNMIGLLTEAASVDLASPVFLRPSELRMPGGGDYAPAHRFLDPWPGGWWRIRDIIDYEHAFANSLLSSIAREPRLWLESVLGAAERASTLNPDEAPIAWILPSTQPDPGATARLVDNLIASGVELSVAQAEFAADGRTWPAGSIVIRADQPYSTHVRDLFEVQRYPEGDAPYDVAGWTLPLLMGVDRVEVVRAHDAKLVPAKTTTEALAGFARQDPSTTLNLGDSDHWRALFGALTKGQGVKVDVDADGRWSAPTNGAKTQIVTLPRIGLYAPWSTSMDEGWMRYVFDTFGVPYVRVRNEQIRAGRLHEFIDVLVLPDVSARELDRGRAKGSIHEPFAEGLAPEGAHAIAEFVRRGGTLVTMDGSARWAIDLFQLPLEDVARGKDAAEFACPGSVLATTPVDDRSFFTAGLQPTVAAFFAGSSAFALKKTDGKDKDVNDDARIDTLLRFAKSNLLLSGWIKKPETIAGQAAWMRAKVGAGRVHLFAFRPHYRGWSQGTYNLLFRAILDGRARSQ